MNKRETASFLAVVKTAYPHFEISEPVVRLWHEFLVDMPFATAQANLREHIKTIGFPPKISEIIGDTPELADYDNLMLETAGRFEQLEHWHDNAVDPPASVIERWGRK